MLSKYFLHVLTILCFLTPPIEAEEAEHPRSWDREKMRKRAEGLILTDDYVHQWLNYPEIQGKTLKGEMKTVDRKFGTAYVDFFLASWCIPCQKITNKFLAITQKYAGANVKFNYIFAHDHKQDAVAFAKVYGIEDGLLANHDILKIFHNPPLPTIYVGDRDGWFLTRYMKASEKDLEELDELLRDTATF
ncbi:MAG: hypothetical protein HYW48_07050 [Deltaproteobacteria bacterium]|nr:hypothetical protein [Deltaproteobacteria bacterium]